MVSDSSIVQGERGDCLVGDKTGHYSQQGSEWPVGVISIPPRVTCLEMLA